MPNHRPFRSWLVAVLAIGALLLAACGDDDDDGGAATTGGTGAPAVETVKSGTLTVCSDVPYEPFEMEGDGPSGYTGFDIQLVDAIAKEIDLDVVVKDTDFEGILGQLAAGTCDMVASSVTITDERAQEVDFTDPYFDAEQSLLVKKDSGYTSLDDLAGKTIGVQSGTTGEIYANENTPDGAQVKGFDGADSLFAALEAGQVDAILQDFPVNAYRTTKDDSVEVVASFKTEEQYGFAVKKGNTALKDALDNGLASFRENGGYDRLYEQYFGAKPGQ